MAWYNKCKENQKFLLEETVIYKSWSIRVKDWSLKMEGSSISPK